MSDTSLWLILAGALLIAELTTGTFYILLVSLGAALGALVAYAGQPLEIQIGSAAVFAVLSCLMLQRARKGSNNPEQDRLRNNLDIGNSVHVGQWSSTGQAQVQYRGASWAAICLDEEPTPGEHVIVDLQGSTLKLKLK